MGVGEMVHLARLRAGLSTRELSQHAGMSPSYVSKLESGAMEPSLKAFARIALITKMTQWEILYCLWIATEDHD